MYSSHSINGYDGVGNITYSPGTCHLATIKLSVGDIFQILSTLDLNPCPGPDDIPYILLRSCIYSLSVPI